MASLCDVGKERYDWPHFGKTCEHGMVALKAWMTFLSASGTVSLTCLGLTWYAAMLQSLFLILRRHFAVGLWAWFQLRNSRTDSNLIPPLKHAAWFEGLSLCTRILPDRNTWTFSLPCLSFMVEMQSVAKSWTLSPHVKLQVVSIWRKMETFTCVIPLAFIADATQPKQCYTAERDETVALFYLLNLSITIYAHSFWQGVRFSICDQASS